MEAHYDHCKIVSQVMMTAKTTWQQGKQNYKTLRTSYVKL